MNDPRATFFPKKKIRLELSGWVPKHNSQDEKRARIDFMIPLIDETREGSMPEWAYQEILLLEREGSAADAIPLHITLEGVTLEFWATPTSTGREQLLTAATLDNFVLCRVTRDKQTFLALKCSTNVKRNWSLLRWLDKYECCYMWAEFTPTDPAQPTKAEHDGAQMTIADAAQSEEAAEEQRVEESQENIGGFFKKDEPEPAEPVAEEDPDDDDYSDDEEEVDAEEVTDAPTPVLHGDMPVQDEVRKAAVEGIDSKPRRPKGFNKSTNPSVN